jgi:hypothetical protein
MNRLGIGVPYVLLFRRKKCEQVKRDSEGGGDTLQSFQTRLPLSALQHANEARVDRNPLREFAL